MSCHRRVRGPAAWCGAVALAFATGGCHAAGHLLAPEPLRAVSVNAFVVEVEFGEPLARASAEDPAHYDLHPAADPSAKATLYSAVLVDSLDGRVVQLLVASGPLPDRAAWEVAVDGVRGDDGRDTGHRVAEFTTGLGYASDMRALFAAHCDACHGAGRMEGAYRTDGMSGLAGGGTDATPNLLAGDPGCRIVRRTLPGRSMYAQGGLDVLESGMIRNWIVEYQARP